MKQFKRKNLRHIPEIMSSMKANNANQELYFDVQQKTDKRHILDNPDTYIGAVETID